MFAHFQKTNVVLECWLAVLLVYSLTDGNGENSALIGYGHITKPQFYILIAFKKGLNWHFFHATS